jgi:hypothetical protein
MTLEPENGQGTVCLSPNGDGRLDQGACGGADTLFTIG